MAISLALRFSPETQIVTRLRRLTNTGLVFDWSRSRRLGCNFSSYFGDPLNPLKRNTSLRQLAEIPLLFTLIIFLSRNNLLLLSRIHFRITRKMSPVRENQVDADKEATLWSGDDCPETKTNCYATTTKQDAARQADIQFRQKFGDAGPLGLSGFAFATFLTALVNLNVHGVTIPNIVIGPALVYGGLAQLLSGMW